MEEDNLVKSVLVQRDDRYFWDILFKQDFDLNHHDLKIRFAGEPASDDGGPLREFLTLCMQNLPLSGLFFGSSESMAFISNPEAVLQKKFYIVGQLTALSILLNGRGPEMFHPAIVRALFERDQPTKIEHIEDAVIKFEMEAITAGNYDSLFDLNISPNGKSKEELVRLYMIVSLIQSKSSAIEQFRHGMNSVSLTILHPQNYEFVRKYLVQSKIEYSFEIVVGLFLYPQVKEFESGSNGELSLRNSVADFELFLLNVGNGDIKLEEERQLSYCDILYFVTGCDRIPSYGFPKPIEVFFSDDITLATASTCGLILTLPKINMDQSLVKSIKFGGGFGTI